LASLLVAFLFGILPLFGESFTWGYIGANITHGLPGGRSDRLVFVSNVFGYCATEINTDNIVKDNELLLRERIRAIVGDDNFEITYNAVFGGSTKQQTEQKRARTLQDPAYARHESWQCECDYPSRSCR
jgi:hypothetical protein